MVSTDELKNLSIKILNKRRELEELKKSKKKNISEIRNFEKKEIPSMYEEFMEKLIEFVDKTDFSDLDLEKFMEPEGYAEAIAVGIKFKRTQLRKFFAEVKGIYEKSKHEEIDSIKITRLIPKLAYSRARDLIDEQFFQFMKLLLDKVRISKKRDYYEKFVEIFEAIVAYHHYYHPKED
jgi:CRISPR-associated protein Csm2